MTAVLQILNAVLAGGVGALSLLALVMSVRHWRRAWGWCLAFLLVTVIVVALWFTHPTIAGWVGLASWVLIVWLPLLAVGRSVKWVLLEDYGRAGAWARIAGWLHPAGAVPYQRRLVAALNMLDEGEVDAGLEELRALDAACPGQEFYSPVDDHRFRGEWEAVRAWVESEVDEPERTANVRHAVPYIIALGETGDLHGLLDAYAAAAPQLSKLRAWGFHDLGRLAIAVYCGRRDELESILAGRMAPWPAASKQVARGMCAMAAGDVDQGRELLREARPGANHANRLFIDRRLEGEPVIAAEVLGERLEERLESARASAAPVGGARLWVRRIARMSLVLIVLGLGAVHWAPWRAKGPVDDDGAFLQYLETVVGDADPESPLPMLVDLHGMGNLPELVGRGFEDLGMPVRLIRPAGPHAQLVGRSWYPLDPREVMTTEVRRSTDRLAELIEHLSETRPTIGKPIVTGFSQGGVLSFALAAFHSDVISAAFPVAGFLPNELPARVGLAPALPVVAFHGADDDPSACRETVDAMRAQGWDARIEVFPDLGHDMNAELRGRLRDELRAALPRR